MERTLEALSYEEALARQKAYVGPPQWLLFSPKPVITLGVRSHFATSSHWNEEEWNRLGVGVLSTDRGGQALFHGPHQILGFPLGNLAQHQGDPRAVKAFVDSLERRLIAFCKAWRRRAGTPNYGGDAVLFRGGRRDHGCGEGAGVWMQLSHESPDSARKVVAIGLRFHRSGISHGFAVNLFSAMNYWQGLMNCGFSAAQWTSLTGEEWNLEGRGHKSGSPPWENQETAKELAYELLATTLVAATAFVGS